MSGGRKGVHSDEKVAELFSSVSAESINEYLQLMEDTESPRLFHIWSLLAASAALLGKNAELKLGALLTVRPNLFVVLIGPPAARKSTPINIVADLLLGTSVNFGPTDSGGQRHGIMSALQGVARYRPSEYVNGYGHVIVPRMRDPRPPSDMALFSSELGRLWGSSNRDLSDFFIDLYDGQGIDYETKASQTRIEQPLVTLLGATTPSSLATMLPENAATHGVLSRILFVYGDTNHKQVPIPPEPTEEWNELRDKVIRRFKWIDNNRRDFGLSPDARTTYESLYGYVPKLEDSRLESFRGRRANILLRVAMCIAALRSDTYVLDDDLRLAHELLVQLEPDMHRALESFGRNKAYMARQGIIQFLKSKPGEKASFEEVIAAVAGDMNRREAEEVIAAMVLQGEITRYGTRIILGKLESTKRPGA